MKINYKNTALAFLEDPMRFPFYLPEYNKELSTADKMELQYGIKQATSTSGFKEQWLNNIQYVTSPFYKAYQQAGPKIKSVVLDTEFEDVGTLIIPWPNHTQTIFYALHTNGKKDNWEYEP